MVKFIPTKDTPELRRVAEIANEIMNMPEIESYVATEAHDELARQLIEGREPSEGMPDVRFKFPRYKS